jgi:hypothetical protein
MKKTSIFQSVALTAVMLIGSLAISSVAQAKTPLEHENAHTVLGEYFKKYNAKGTIVVLDKRNKQNKFWVYDQERAQQRFSPESENIRSPTELEPHLLAYPLWPTTTA